MTAAEALSAPSRHAIDPKLIREAGNEVCLARKGGKSPIYFAVEARFFSLEEPVAPAGNEIFVRRKYLRLAPRPTLLRGHVLERELLLDGGKAGSGEARRGGPHHRGQKQLRVPGLRGLEARRL